MADHSFLTIGDLHYYFETHRDEIVRVVLGVMTDEGIYDNATMYVDVEERRRHRVAFVETVVRSTLAAIEAGFAQDDEDARA